MTRSHGSFLNKKTYKRVISFVTAVVTALPIVAPKEILEDLHLPHFVFPAFADEVPDDINGLVKKITSWEELEEFSKTYHGHEDLYKYAKIEISKTVGQPRSGGLIDDFCSLGSEDHPFSGILMIDSEIESFELNVPLFDYISDHAKIIQPIIDRDPDEETDIIRIPIAARTSGHPLFANHVKHDPRTTEEDPSWEWIIDAQYNKDRDGNSSSQYFSSLIGTIEENADVKVKFIDNSDFEMDGHKQTPIQGTGNVGAICGEMKENSKLSVTLEKDNSTDKTIVISTGGNAGGLVGEMKEGSSLSVYGSGTITSVTASNGNAGGLVGIATDATITLGGDLVYTGVTVTGKDSAGGVFGYYTNTAGTFKEPFDFDLANYVNLSCELSAAETGGIFGKLENKGYMVISGGNNATVSSSSTSTASNTNYGGIAGWYKTDDLERSLTINNVKTVMESPGNLTYYGGVIGKISVSSKSAYIKVDSIEVDASNVKGTFGGVIACACEAPGSDVTDINSVNKGNFIDVGSVKVNTNNTAFTGGGIVGRLDSGILRLSGETDLTGSKPNTKNNIGHIIGQRGQALIYAVGNGNDSNWTLKRNSIASDDCGTWGEVLRGTEAVPLSGILEEDIIRPADSNVAPTHKVKIKNAAVTMDSTSAFIRTALNIQLNGGADVGALCFEDRVNISSELLKNKTLSITGDVHLECTGITGLMRDDGKSVDGNDDAVFTGKLTGTSGKTVSLAIGEGYGDGSFTGYDRSSYRGRIYRHRYVGLLARTGNTAEIKDLNVGGTVYVHVAGDGSSYGYVGGLDAYHSNGTLTMDNISSSVTIETSADNDAHGLCLSSRKCIKGARKSA